MKDKIKAAVAQFVPVHMNKQATLEKLADLVLEAGRNGAEILVTGETSIPTYPYWRNRFTYSDPDPEITAAWRSVVIEYYDQSVRIPDDLDGLCRAAKKAGVYCVIGVSEQDDQPGSMTLYNTQVLIGPDGSIVGRHRKLMPTHEERVVWGAGDGSDLAVWDTSLGCIGALVCYENHMLLPKAALAFMGEEIHCCCWPGWLGAVSEKGFSESTNLSNSDIDSCLREYAFSTQNFVLSASNYAPLDAVPDSFPFKKYGNWGWAIGGSAIVSPSGSYLAGPVFNEETILYAELDRSERIRAKIRIDSVGHYSRADLMTLLVDRSHDRGLTQKFGGSLPDEVRALEDVDRVSKAALVARGE
ncbi:MAG TPA: carbon-nitrogen hydrolase family protein [Nevskiaceae bacterium]|nr:carbon-nitrogen hydrolase family protein [Nevskiaceae bacterium]